MGTALSLGLALFGMFITLYGRWLHKPSARQQHAFLWGAVLLLAGAIIDFEPVLIVFESILILGCLLGFTALSSKTKTASLALASITGVIILLSTTTVTSLVLYGCFSLLVGANGFALRSTKVQLVSAGLLTAYNILSYYSGNQVALIFAILNLIFGILALRVLLNKSE